MTEKSFRSRFVWHDMMSTDAKAAKAFYTGLFGWRVEEHQGLGPYDMLHVGDVAIGGIIQIDPERMPGVPSHWVAYVEVEDAAACAARNEAGGGKVIVPVVQIPGTGSFSMLSDPRGAVFSCWQNAEGKERGTPADKPPIGAFIWNELHAQEPAASMTFYGEVFGWTYRDMDMGPGGKYHIIQSADGTDVGGMMKPPEEAGDYQAWLSYVHVEDVDASQAKATGLGAKTVVPPSDIPGMGRFSVMADPTGGIFAVYQPASPA